MSKNTIKPLVLTSIDSSGFTGEFMPINPNGMEAACFLTRISNNSTESIIISFDGVHDHEFIKSDDSIELQFQTNSGPVNNSAYVAKGTIVYARAFDDVGDGFVFLSGYYQLN